MSFKTGNVLVTVINTSKDLDLLLNRRLYRIPVDSYEKFIKKRWTNEFIAFYQTSVFGSYGYRINFTANVESFTEIFRQDLFPNEPVTSKKYNKKYFLFSLTDLKMLKHPVLSLSKRVIVFIISNKQQLNNATEINDLYIGSKIETTLWNALKQNSIKANREEFVKARGNHYALDFAIYCKKGKIGIETDGDFWHSNPAQATLDNKRDNNLKTAGWQLLRFNESQIFNELNSECIPIIKENIKIYGGIA